MKSKKVETSFNQKLIQDIKTLKRLEVIRFDNDIANELSYGKANLSNYISGKVRASQPFLDMFYKKYGDNLKNSNGTTDALHIIGSLTSQLDAKDRQIEELKAEIEKIRAKFRAKR